MIETVSPEQARAKRPTVAPAPSPKARLTLEVPETVRELLTGLQHRSNASSITEVVRKALAVYDLFLEHASEGGSVIFRYKDGDEEKLRLI